MDIALRYAARSNVGLGPKSRNEDSAYAGPHLLVLADGMGGHAAGDVASSMVVGEMVHLDGESHGSDDALELLAHSLRTANQGLHEAMEGNAELEGMGTTVVAMLRTGNKMALANIGDSRGYLLRGGTLTQITRDHSYVQSLLDEGRITPEEAEHHPQRSLVTRVLTGHEGDEPDLSMREARPGDRYLICSDGLSDFVAGDTIEEVMTEGLGTAATAERLIEIALRAGTRDNVTVIVGDVVDLEQGDAPSTAPEVVGAAADRRRTRPTRAMPVSPAEKAAALSRQVSAADGEVDEVELAESGPSSGKLRWLRRTGLVALVLVVLAGGAYAAYDWTQRQYFVGAAGDHVAIYQGVSQDIGPWRLSHVSDRTDVLLEDLPDYFRDRVNATMSQSSSQEARLLVTDLRSAAVACRTQKASGRPCGSAITIPSSTSASRPPSSTPSAPSTSPTSRPPTSPARKAPAIRPSTTPSS
jgi:PPM family protein phosphatase